MGLVPPEPGYLEPLRELTAKHGDPPGLRRGDDRLPLAFGGAQERFGDHARPDGAGQDHRRRPAGGGLWGVRRRSWTTSRPPGRSSRRARSRATRWPWPPGLATLRHPPRRAALRPARSPLGPPRRGARPRRHRRRSPPRRPARRQHAHPLLQPRPGPQLRRRPAERHRLFGRFFWEMLARGVYLPCSQFEAAFVSAAHTEADIDQTIEAAGRRSRPAGDKSDRP